MVLQTRENSFGTLRPARMPRCSSVFLVFYTVRRCFCDAIPLVLHRLLSVNGYAEVPEGTVTVLFFSSGILFDIFT